MGCQAGEEFKGVLVSCYIRFVGTIVRAITLDSYSFSGGLACSAILQIQVLIAQGSVPRVPG